MTDTPTETTEVEADAFGPTITRSDPMPTNVVQAIAAVMAEMGGIPKMSAAAHKARSGVQDAGPERGVSYAYRSIDQIAAAAQPLLGHYGVVILPDVVEHDITDITVGGNPWTSHMMKVEWHVFGPGGVADRLPPFKTVGEGRDNSDKGANKAQTMAFKNALLRVLCIGDPADDPDHGKFLTDEVPGKAANEWWGGWADEAEHRAYFNEIKAFIAETFDSDDRRVLATEFRTRYGSATNPGGWPITTDQADEWRSYVEGLRDAQGGTWREARAAAGETVEDDHPDDVPDAGDAPTPESIAAQLGGDLVTVGMPAADEPDPEPMQPAPEREKPGSKAKGSKS